MHVERYNTALKREWDEFVKLAKNSHFLFLRDYIEYHQDRFDDISLIVRKKPNGKIIAMLPACEKNSNIYSHLGLTFGGFIVSTQMTTAMMLDVFSNIKKFLRELGYLKLYYKAMPHIYHKGSAEEDLYALFRNKADLYRVDVSSVLDYRWQPPKSRIFERNVKNGDNFGLEVKKTEDYKSFMKIVYDCLKEKYSTLPTHNTEEIEYLASKFPQNIELYGCYLDSILVAGAIVYKSETAATLQYAFANTSGKEVGSLQFLINTLIKKYEKTSSYFVYGISTENEGQYLNEDLIRTKEYSGCRAIVYQFYCLDL